MTFGKLGSSPRVRESRSTAVMRSWASGSSPRVRGKRLPGREGGLRGRLIPARAGKTSRGSSTASSAWAHPRACGENLVYLMLLTAGFGSSPRVRGKPQGPCPVGRLGGLIPARAGKTHLTEEEEACTKAHPRACGENSGEVSSSRSATGSSPRVRGKPHQLGGQGPRRRLIPARAGKTRGASKPASGLEAHPRACGENARRCRRRRGGRGSSPRVRGKRAERRQDVRRGGLIPARAGKTAEGAQRVRADEAHPRACGENPLPTGGRSSAAGSSPRVRGKPPPLPLHRRPHRLIPARAGKTKRESSTPRSRRAHPRACGENYAPMIAALGSAGSSPRVRGKPQPLAPHAPHPRLIPARAGKTPPIAGAR